VFIRQYNKAKENGLLPNFREEELEFFKLKLENPYSSLAELTKLYEEKTKIKKTRAGLSHYLIKLRKVISNV